jgi:copper chaperone
MSNIDTYTVQGMTCGNCAGKVTAAVTEIPGVSGTDIDIATGTLTVSGDSYNDAAVRTAIVEAGYQVA